MANRSTYRKTRSADVWHFCMNCREWPVKNFEEISSTMESPAELCAECAKLEQARECQTSDEVVP